MNLDNIKILLQDISQFEILEIIDNSAKHKGHNGVCLLYTSPSPRDNR